MQTARKSPRELAPAMPRTERLEARISPDLKDLYTLAANMRGQSLTDFIVSTMTDAARRVVRESEVLEWSRRDQQAFAAALMDPPPPVSKLTAAAAWAREQARTNG